MNEYIYTNVPFIFCKVLQTLLEVLSRNLARGSHGGAGRGVECGKEVVETMKKDFSEKE